MSQIALRFRQDANGRCRASLPGDRVGGRAQHCVGPGSGLGDGCLFSTIDQTDDPVFSSCSRPTAPPSCSHRFRDGRAPEYTTLDGKPFPVNESDRLVAGSEPFRSSPRKADWSLIRPVAPEIEAYTDGRPVADRLVFCAIPPSRKALATLSVTIAFRSSESAIWARPVFKSTGADRESGVCDSRGPVPDRGVLPH